MSEDHWEQDQLKSVAAIPTTLYHATFEELVSRIMKNGIIPSKIGPNFGDTDSRFVYFGTSASKCKALIEDLYQNSRVLSSRLSGQVNVLTVKTSGLDKKKFFHDPKSQLLMMDAYMYMGVVPAKNIVDLGD